MILQQIVSDGNSCQGRPPAAAQAGASKAKALPPLRRARADSLRVAIQNHGSILLDAAGYRELREEHGLTRPDVARAIDDLAAEVDNVPAVNGNN